MFREFCIFILAIVRVGIVKKGTCWETSRDTSERGNTLKYQPYSNLTTDLTSPTGLIKITAENATAKGSFCLKTRSPTKIFQNMALMCPNLCQGHSRIRFSMIQSVLRTLNFSNFFSIFVCKIWRSAPDSQLLGGITRFLDRNSKKEKPFRYNRFTWITCEQFR